MGALATYALFVWDSGLTSPSPHIDDYVYYVKAATRWGLMARLVLVMLQLVAVSSLCADAWWMFLRFLLLPDVS